MRRRRPPRTPVARTASASPAILSVVAALALEPRLARAQAPVVPAAPIADSARAPAPDSMTSAATAAPGAVRGYGVGLGRGPAAQADTTPRARAVEYSEGYARRLAVHRYASYTMVPLFAAQYALGDRLLGQKSDLFAGRRREPVDDGLRTAHNVTAAGVGALFAVNTVTGVWNLYEARNDPSGRRRRTTHVLTMLAADAGFVATGVMGSRGSANTPREARQHRAVGLASMTVAAVGASIMWFFDED